MQSVDKVHVRDDVLLILSLWNVVEHGRILWLCEGQLIVHQVPKRFSLRLVASSDLLLGHLAPSALTDDAIDLQRIKEVNIDFVHGRVDLHCQ